MLSTMLDCLKRWMNPAALGGPALPAGPAVLPANNNDSPDEDSGEPLVAREDLKRAGSLLRHAGELTTAVAEEVGQHQSQIQTINVELAGVAEGDAAAVAAVIGKLLAANQDLQTRLERAELKLQAHSRQLQDVAVAARTDGLTGLMNRRALDEELRRSLGELTRRGRTAALLMLDVDHFKRFNDTHGHVAGDEALKYVADSLRSHARETDIVARFGGEEFAIVFTATTATAVRRRADEVRAAIGQGRLLIDGQQVRITASSGLAQPQPDDDIATWLKRADEALYSAKNAGRNCGFWHGPEGLVRIEPPPAQPIDAAIGEIFEDADKASRSSRQYAAELAAEAFADTTFVLQVGRRIAEWRRGGATFSVMLARLAGTPEAEPDPDANSPRQRAIRAVLQLARGCIREMDVLTRWTSDGLAVLLPGAGLAETRIAARRLHSALARCETPAHQPIERLVLCTGIAEGIEGNDANRVLQRAWLALEAAAGAGPGTIYIHDGLKPQAVNPSAVARVV